ncbi:hypothetical protein HQ520_06900 [bacterium]|nr:hypothetical protein [bacterium]
MPKLEGLKWQPRWVSLMGCIEGCLAYQKKQITPGWLYGATGHAFALSIAKGICPSGPTAWNTKRLFELGKNVGFETKHITAEPNAADFADQQKKAFEFVDQSLQATVPCYGWELNIPEYYVITGTDKTGYYYSGPMCENAEQPKPWENLGKSETAYLNVTAVSACEPADDIKTVREALQFAVDLARNGKEYLLDWNREWADAGLSAYDRWAQELHTGQPDELGMPYNAACWAECRHFAVEFLKEATQKLIENGPIASQHRPLFDSAVTHYAMVEAKLKRVSEIFPFRDRRPEYLQDPKRVTAAIDLIRTAKQSEEMGVAKLQEIAGIL